MLKNLFSNPVTRTFIALVVTLIFISGAFFLYITGPDNFGHTSLSFATDTVYYFADHWQVAYDYATVKFSPGTLVIPGYYRGQVTAVLLIPPEAHPGTISFTFPREFRGDLPETVVDNLDQAVILLDYSDYTKLFQDSGDTILLRADEDTEANAPHKYLELQLKQGINLLTSYDMFGYTNWLLPTPQTVLLGLWGQRIGFLSYYEDANVEAAASDFDVKFAHPGLTKQFYPPEGYKTVSLAYMALLTLTALGFITFVTGGVEVENSEVEGRYNNYWTTAVLIGAAVCAAGISYFGGYFQTQAHITAFFWALPLAGIAFWARKVRLKPSFFGVSAHGLGVSCLAAVGACALIALGSALTIPVGFQFSSAHLFLALAIFLREAFLRGFFQRIVSHWLHPLAGLFLTAVLWALIATYTQAEASGPLFLASAFCKSLAVGYLFFRSKNLFAACLFGTLLELTPQIIQF